MKSIALTLAMVSHGRVICEPDYTRCEITIRVFFDHLERLNEGPEKNADGVALPEKLDETGGSEKTEEPNVDEVFLQEAKEYKIQGRKMGNSKIQDHKYRTSRRA